MPGRSDNLSVFDPYPFSDLPSLAPADPDPDPELLGVQAYASEPPQPVIMLSPSIQILTFGIDVGFTVRALNYIPNQIFDPSPFEFGIDVGFEVFDTIIEFGIDIGFEIEFPPVVEFGIEVGFEVEEGIAQTLTTLARWAMNEPQFIDSLGGYDFRATTGRFTTNPYLDPIDVSSGEDGSTRMESSTALNFISPISSVFASNGESIEFQFEFYLEVPFTEFEIGSGSVQAITPTLEREQWLIQLRWFSSLNTYLLESTFFLRNPTGDGYDPETLSIFSNLTIQRWHRFYVRFDLTTKEIQVVLNNTVYTQLFVFDRPAAIATNPGIYIDPTFDGSFRIRDIEYGRGVVASPITYVTFGIDVGFEVSSPSTGGGGGANLVSSWALNTSTWTDTVSGLDFYLSAAPNSVPYSDTPTVVTGVGGYTLFNNDFDFYGLYLRTPAEPEFISNADIKLEFDIYGEFLSYGEEDELFNCGDLTNFDFQWRVALRFNYDLEFHVIEASVYVYDSVLEFIRIETFRHSAAITEATWKNVQIEFNASAYEVAISVDGVVETFAYVNGDFNVNATTTAWIGIGRSLWASTLRLRNVQYSK